MLDKLLGLTVPLVSTDLETTGTNADRDRIVQVGIVKVYPDGHMTEWQTLVNPGINLSQEVERFFADNGVRISNEILQHGCVKCTRKKEEHVNPNDECAEFVPVPSFASIAPVLYAGLNGCDLAGYNLGTFDVPLLRNEFKRVAVDWKPGRIVDGLRMAQRVNPRNLAWFAEKYAMPEKLQGFKAHDALHDARITVHGLVGFFQHHPDFPRDVQKLHDMFFVEPRDANTLDPDGKFAWQDGEAIVNFGKKHKGKTLREVKALDPGFLRDFILKGDFNPIVQKIARDALAGKFPVKA